MNAPRRRPLAIGPLRAFEAVARRLNFSAAAVELHLTQPAVSRQIRALEDELGTPLFVRGTRHVELTAAGATLLRHAGALIGQLDAGVRQIRDRHHRPPVTVATFASFAALWLLPRLQRFQASHPESDLRIVAGDDVLSFDDPDIDVALRYGPTPDGADAGGGATRLFGDAWSPMASPALLQRTPIGAVADLARHTLLDGAELRRGPGYLDWHGWFAAQPAPAPVPRGWIYLDYMSQQVQAAVAGQGVALARCALVAEALARGELVEPFGANGRVASPSAYWLVRWPQRRERPALAAFEEWVLAEAQATSTGLAAATAAAAASEASSAAAVSAAAAATDAAATLAATAAAGRVAAKQGAARARSTHRATAAAAAKRAPSSATPSENP